MTGPDTSLVGGVVIIPALTVLNLAVGRLEPLRFFHRVLVSESHHPDQGRRVPRGGHAPRER